MLARKLIVRGASLVTLQVSSAAKDQIEGGGRSVFQSLQRPTSASIIISTRSDEHSSKQNDNDNDIVEISRVMLVF